MATKVNKKKRAKKSKVSSSGVELQDQVEETVQRTPGPCLVDDAPSHEQEAPSLSDTGLHQLNQRQCQDVEHPRDAAVSISAERQFIDDPTSGKKSKKKLTKKPSLSSSMKPNSSEVPSEPKEEKSFTFEEQVDWCIRQLELGLHHRDATKAQKDSNEKNIRTLRSLKVPVPRKRQLMRSLFGDYRSKMAATPLPEARAKEPRVSKVEREVVGECGKFFKYKHSHIQLPKFNGGEGCNSYTEEQESFRFDFVINS